MNITTYRVEKESLDGMLGEAADGSTQLPDFQRGWVWDDDHVRSLLASISLGYPIGTVMMLRAGGETVRFKQRPLEGAPTPKNREADRLILDGQQRLTSLFQSLRLDRPVLTRDQRGRTMAFPIIRDGFHTRGRFYLRPAGVGRCPVRQRQ